MSEWTTEDLLEECQKRAHKLIKEGKLLREIDMRLIVRQVIREALSSEGLKKDSDDN